MPVTNRIIANTQAFDFASYPIQTTIGAGFTYTAVWNATSTGDLIGNNGYRIWDTSTRLANGSVLVTPTQPWVAPLTNAYLPSTYWDGIIDLNIDGQAIPLAFSNSPDNFSTYDGDTTLTTTPNLYWINLLRCQPNATPPSAQSNNNYFFGASPLQYSGAGVADVLKLNLYQAVPAGTGQFARFTYLMEYISTNGQVLGPWTGGITVTRSSGTRNITLGGFPAGMSTNPQGYMRISVFSEEGYRSLLPYYHWGLNF